MARFCAEKNTAPKFEAVNQWKEKCLLGHGSLFSDENIWNAENVKVLIDHFVNKPDEGDGNFFEKMEGQLSSTPPQVKMLAAEMLWFMLICPSNIGVDSKRDSILRVWAWSGTALELSHPMLGVDVLDGIGSSGTSYNTNRWREFGYFTRELEAFYRLKESTQTELLGDGWALAKWLEAIPENDTRQLRHMILFLLFPDDFERIFGGTDRKAVVKAFTNLTSARIKQLTAREIDKELFDIRQQQVADFGTDDLDFYRPPLKDMWKKGAGKHWLFAWNPNNYAWDELHDEIAQIEAGKTVVGRWSCSNLNMGPGDRAWLIRVGVQPKGIMATGNVISEPYEAEHFDPEKAKRGKNCNYVDIEFTKILDVFKDTFVELQDLERITIDKQDWMPRSSGIEIQDRSAGLLEKLWSQVAKSRHSKVSELSPIMKHEPKNLILYGPPGTGKTYQLSKLRENYTSKKGSISREQWLAEQVDQLRWFDVVFMALYDIGGRAKVTDILQHEFVVQKAKVTGRSSNVRAQIWASLQKHASEESDTVKYSKRHPPFVCDKTEQSEWFLMDNFKDECAEQIALVAKLKEGPDKVELSTRYEFVTFHQAYSYEDFLEGIRPTQEEDSEEVSYSVKPGVFKRICARAKADPANQYAIFIDEINRGNIAKIFGELITLIEDDKRAGMENEVKITLPYSGEVFSVPANLDIYGTMNTADRSIALLDTALRRRFKFKELMPNTGVITGSRGDGYIEDGEGGVINLRELLEAMNTRIRFLLNRDLMLGHAYFSKVRTFSELKAVMLDQIVPLLQEYFYEDWRRIQLVFRDIVEGGEPAELQIIIGESLSGVDVLGFDHEDFDDVIEYSVAKPQQIIPETIRKIYE